MLVVRRLAVLLLLPGELACGSGARVAPHDAGPEAATGSPSLVQLEITTAGAWPKTLELVPAFSPTIHDYYVRCARGENVVAVTALASPGVKASIQSPRPSGPHDEHTFSLAVNEGEAIVAAAADARGTTEYWVRCLPHDFPLIEMTPHPEAGAPSPGYYIVGVDSPPAGRSGYAMILDADGVPVWYLRQPQGAGVFDVENLVADTISFIPLLNDVPYELHDLATAATTYSIPCEEHELRALPNGHLLVLAAPILTGDLTGLSTPLPDGGVRALGPGSSFYGCYVLESDARGDVVWQWVASDHFDPVEAMTYFAPAVPQPDGGAVIEPFHCNSIDVDEGGNLLVSARNMDSIFYVEKSSGRVLWKLGGTRGSKDGATYIRVDDPFHRQHDARLQPGWKATSTEASGAISVFDDETATGTPARAAVYDVDVHYAPPADAGDAGAADAEAGPSRANLVWQRKGQAPSLEEGSFRISADGSRVIDWGRGAPVVFSEVDAEGRDLLDFTFPEGTTSYRAVKVPSSAFDIGMLRRTAGTQ